VSQQPLLSCAPENYFVRKNTKSKNIQTEAQNTLDRSPGDINQIKKKQSL